MRWPPRRRASPSASWPPSARCSRIAAWPFASAGPSAPEVAVTSPTRDLVAAARAGRTVYLSDVRRAFAGLDPAGSVAVTCAFAGLDGAARGYELRLPRLAGLPQAERDLVTEYFLASVYNIVSTIGGSELRISAAGDAPEAAELAGEVVRAFGVERLRRDRPGYGRALNVAERMNEAVPGGAAARRFRCAAVPHRAPAA